VEYARPVGVKQEVFHQAEYARPAGVKQAVSHQAGYARPVGVKQEVFHQVEYARPAVHKVAFHRGSPDDDRQEEPRWEVFHQAGYAHPAEGPDEREVRNQADFSQVALPLLAV